MSESSNQTNQKGDSTQKGRQRPHYKKAPSRKSDSQLLVQTRVPVDPKYVGAVIGRGGATITNIKEETNTQISLKKPEYERGNQCHVFNVIGSPVGVSKAEKWIKNILQSTWEAEQEREAPEEEAPEEASPEEAAPEE